MRHVNYVVVVNLALVRSNKNTLGHDLAGVTIAKRVPQTNLRRQTHRWKKGLHVGIMP
jgi:hypothetical protein